jgi:hypothetical protein
VYAQTAEVGGTVQDPSGAVIPRASVEFRNQDTGIRRQAKTNGDGLYQIGSVDPGKYDATIEASGFKTLTKENIVFHVGDKARIDFRVQVGQESQTVNVDGSGVQLNTTDGSVSTVIDRKFVENIPLNGRSFQGLILLTPGAITNSPQRASTLGTTGEFSVNGQRTESNYYTVDGVSANTGASSNLNGAGIAGSLPGATALGTTQGLVSVDDLQEFRVESSTYSAEYGRNPGGQFSMVTRSGTNDLHGTVFEYFRNDALDANSWFNKNTSPITRRPPERQNDFGGTLGGHLFIPHFYDGRGKTFFFGSYEGLRLVQPKDVSTNFVPTLALRQSSPGMLSQALNAFPLPTQGAPDLGNGLTEFIAGWSTPSNLDSTSVRIDQVIGARNRAFFRFSDTPSSAISRGSSANGGASTPSAVTKSLYGNETYTGGLTTNINSVSDNEFRINFTSGNGSSITYLDNFGGAQPIDLAQIHGIDPSQSYYVSVALNFPGYGPGISASNYIGTQSQWNITDSYSMVFGKHHLKVGIDWRRLAPVKSTTASGAVYYFGSQASVAANSVTTGVGEAYAPAHPIYKNFSSFVQDEWHLAGRLNLSLGLRWDVNPAPGVSQDLMPYTVTGLNNLSQLKLAPQGTPLWQTSWYDFAPRLGFAYTASPAVGYETVIRGGGGVFFDTGQQTGSAGFNGVGFSKLNYFGTTYNVPASFPVSHSVVSPTIVSPPVAPYGLVYTNPSNLQAPFTYQWNASIEQGFGRAQSLTVSYVGANGRKLLRQEDISASRYNPSFSTLIVYTNGLSSSYNALQTKFQRQIAHGLQSLVSYTWSHALDFGSYNAAFPYQRGNSDLDVRNNLAAAASYELPSPGKSILSRIILSQWGIDGRFTARDGFPVTLSGNIVIDPATGMEYYGGVNVIPGVPVYTSGTTIYGRKRINPAAFVLPTSGYGNAPRNFVTGFGAAQMDLAVRRQFLIADKLHGQFRVEAFNISNHPIFGTISSYNGNVQFGQATATLAQSLGVLSPLYQTGGPRSVQLALKLTF